MQADSDVATRMSVLEHAPAQLELAPTLSSNASMGRHVRRASSIAGQRAQKAQAESRRAANAILQQVCWNAIEYPSINNVVISVIVVLRDCPIGARNVPCLQSVTLKPRPDVGMEYLGPDSQH